MTLNKEHLLLLAIAFSTVASNSQSHAENIEPKDQPIKEKKIVCYFDNSARLRLDYGTFLPANIDPFLCTHIIYAYGWLKEGKLLSSIEDEESKPGGLYDGINNLKNDNPKLKTLLALGGFAFGGKWFRDIAYTEPARQTFISSAIPFLREKGFDGLDIFWTRPEEVDRNNYVSLLKDLKEAFDVEANNTRKPRLLLTAAVTEGDGYNVQEVSRYVDVISVIAFDLRSYKENGTGHHAPLYAHAKDPGWRQKLTVDSTVKMWETAGAPKDKLVVGMSTYGISFTLSDLGKSGVDAPISVAGKAGEYTRVAGILSYYEVCKMLRSGGASYIWDDEMMVPYAVVGDQWVGFDDQRSLRNKMKWLKDNGYAGAMVWSFSMDDFRGELCCTQYPLHGVIREELRGSKRWPKVYEVDWSKEVGNATREYTPKYDL